MHPADGSSTDGKIAADLRPSADGSAVRTSLVASVPIAQAAAPWDRQTDGSRYSKMPPLGRGIKRIGICAVKTTNEEE